MFNLYALVGKKLKYFFPFAAYYHLTCKNNINAIIINAAYQLKDVEAGLKVVVSICIYYRAMYQQHRVIDLLDSHDEIDDHGDGAHNCDVQQ